MNTFMRKVFPIIFIISAITMTGFGIYNTFFANKGLKKTDAVIKKIIITDLGPSADDTGHDYDYEVYVDYEVDGKKYTDASLDTYTAGYKEGKTIKIFYDPNDPSVIHGDVKGMGIYMMIGGPVILVIGLIILFRNS